MNMENRTRDLYIMRNNIQSECMKMVEHLQSIQEKSDDAISSLVHLSNSNLLRKYASAFEYLNKFYLKLLNQNCAFELFFLELEESAEVAGKQSVCTNSANITRVSDSVACSECNLDNASVPETSRKLLQPSFDRNIFQTCFDRSVSRCSNVIHQELQILDNSAVPVSHTTDNIVCNVDNSQATVVESATTIVPEVSLGLKNQYLRSTSLNKEPKIDNSYVTVCLKSECKVTLAEEASNINKENIAQTSLVSDDTLRLNSSTNHEEELEEKKEDSVSSTVSNDFVNLNNEETSQSVYSGFDHGKSATMDSISTSSDQITEPEIIETEAVVESTKINTEIDTTVTKDLKTALKNIEERFKEKKSKRPFAMPDLRPTVKKNNYSSEENISLAVDDIRSCENKSIRKKIVPKKDDLDYNIIVPKRGPLPQLGEICYVSSAESPSSLYIQIIREDNTLVDYLSDQIAEIASNLKQYKSKIDAHRAIDKYCVCYVEEYKTWYRAEIVKWLLDDDEYVLVRLIDHGYTCMVRLMFIRKAISFFFALPIMAEKCELAMIKPPNELDEWPVNSVNYFYDIVNPKANKLFTISFIERTGDTFMIDLESNDMDSLVETMIVTGHAVQNIPNETDNGLNEFMRKQILKSQSLDEDMSEEERIEKAFEFDDEEVDDPNIAVSHYSARDESEICKIFLARGSCFKGNTCRFSHKPLNPDGWTTDKEAVYYDSFHKLQLPNPGTEITVKIIHIVDIRTFYVVLKNLPYSAYLQDLSINTIKALVKSMNSADEVKTYRTTNVIPALSQMILVKYLDLWQRGRVIDITEYANRVELSVFLVDFGIDITVNMRDTRCIKAQHLQLPFQAVRCTLSNVVLKEDMTDHENDMACDYLEINVLFKKLKARVTHNCEYLSVLLYNEDGQDIGLELLQSGIVEECRQAITPREEQGFLVD